MTTGQTYSLLKLEAAVTAADFASITVGVYPPGVDPLAVPAPPPLLTVVYQGRFEDADDVWVAGIETLAATELARLAAEQAAQQAAQAAVDALVARVRRYDGVVLPLTLPGGGA